jgi:hypothetical protein
MHFEVQIGESQEIEHVDADEVHDMPPFLIYTKNGQEVYRANASFVKKSKAVFSPQEAN